jgi:hypothetical protein
MEPLESSMVSNWSSLPIERMNNVGYLSGVTDMQSTKIILCIKANCSTALVKH